MALYFKTDTPNKLLADFKKAIDDKKIDTWSYDSDGDFTHTPPQWKGLAWLRPKIEAGKLTLFILNLPGKKVTPEVYAIYHGRFIEAMIRHCDTLFTEGTASALAKDGDKVG